MRRLLIIVAAVAATLAPLTAGATAPVTVLKIDGIINAGTVRYVKRGLDGARADSAPLAVIVLNTPGGLLSSTREIVQAIDASPVPVAVYVAPGGASATSAGTIITMSAHFAAMAPGTNIGAAHPVGSQGEDIKGTMKEKAENDTVAFIVGQARLRGRNVEWAEQAIRKSVALAADDALARHVVDFVARDISELISAINAKNAGRFHVDPAAALHEIPQTLSERFLVFIGDPNVSYMLMTLGGLGIYVELTSPGVVLPGVAGVIALILAFISFTTLPVNAGGVALLVLGLLLFGLEAFVPSYGALTVGGIASLILGALFLLDPASGDLRLSMGLVAPTVLAMGALTLAIAYFAIRSRRQVYGGLANFGDFEGTVQSLDVSGAAGKCVIRGETWDFELSDQRERVQIGDRLLVIERRGMRLVVEKKK